MNKHRIKSLIREWQLIIKHYKFSPRVINRKETTLIFVCDGSIQHGGFVDRLKGIISFYALAKEQGWNFKIYYSHPFFLNSFFNESKTTWSINSIEKYFPAASPVWEFDRPVVDVKNLIKRFLKGGVFHVYSNVDFLHQLIPDFSKRDVHKLWGLFFNDLFKMSDNLKYEVEKILGNAQSPIGIHLRFTNLLRDFSDTPTLKIPLSQQNEILEGCLKKVGEIIEINQGNQFFIFSDSSRFIDACKKEYPFIRTTPGVPQHTDQDKVKSNDHDKTVLDFILLTRMKSIYQVKHKLMYNSNFSRYASYVNAIPFELATLNFDTR